jgi:hypothetical protein
MVFDRTQCMILSKIELQRIEYRTSGSVMPLGEAIFLDDDEWKNYRFPEGSSLDRDALVYCYRSQHWPGRQMVWVPYGRLSMTLDS